MISINTFMAGMYKTRQAETDCLIAGIFMPVEHCFHDDLAVINGCGYGVEVGNTRVAPAVNTDPIRFDRRKPAVSVLIEAMTVTFNDGYINTLMEAVMPNLAKTTTTTFLGQQITVVAHNSEPYVSPKEITENLGLDWKGQYSKLNHNRTRWGMEKISIPSNGGRQTTVALPLRKLPGWLMTIQPNKCPNELRPKIISYQTEADEVLWNHWKEKYTGQGTQQLPLTTPAQTLTIITTLIPGQSPKSQAHTGKVICFTEAAIRTYESQMSKTIRAYERSVNNHFCTLLETAHSNAAATDKALQHTN